MMLIWNLASALIRFNIFVMCDLVIEIKSHFDGSFHLFNKKRILSLVILFLIINFLILWNHTGFILDDILFRKWRETKIHHSPLFIVGNARSGTTLFHRLLSLQTDKFTSMKLWEILFAVSITWRIVISYIYILDQSLFYGSLYNLIILFDKKVFSCISMHKFSLFESEEDEWLMVHTFQSQLILLFFPLGLQINPIFSIIPRLPAFETMLTYKERNSIFSYYKECIQRHLYAIQLLKPSTTTTSSSFIYLSKNPTFTTRLHSIIQIFPNCHIACMIRDPIESVPSMISYIAAMWSLTNVPVHKYPKAQQLFGFCVLHYKYF